MDFHRKAIHETVVITMSRLKKMIRQIAVIREGIRETGTVLTFFRKVLCIR